MEGLIIRSWKIKEPCQSGRCDYSEWRWVNTRGDPCFVSCDRSCNTCSYFTCRVFRWKSRAKARVKLILHSLTCLCTSLEYMWGFKTISQIVQFFYFKMWFTMLTISHDNIWYTAECLRSSAVNPLEKAALTLLWRPLQAKHFHTTGRKSQNSNAVCLYAFKPPKVKLKLQPQRLSCKDYSTLILFLFWVVSLLVHHFGPD